MNNKKEISRKDFFKNLTDCLISDAVDFREDFYTVFCVKSNLSFWIGNGYTQERIAAFFKTDQSNVSRILKGVLSEYDI